jgi:hypothetical protein
MPLEPNAERRADLLTTLRALKAVSKLSQKHPSLIPQGASPLLYSCFPWIAQPVDVTQIAILERRARQFSEAGFDGEEAKRKLQGILDSDIHLRECCPTLGHLANCLDLYFIMPAFRQPQLSTGDANANGIFKQFCCLIYGNGPFRTIAYSHLFNFFADQSRIPFCDARIERLDRVDIARVVGEPTAISFIHPSGAGDFFLVVDQAGPCENPVHWLSQMKSQAEESVYLLQYFKDGVVHVDYAAVGFMPDWVNTVRKGGIFFLGNPRRNPFELGKRPYTLNEEEIGNLARWWQIYKSPEFSTRFKDLTKDLRQAILRASEYFELNHTQDRPVDRLVNLAVAFESLFSPSGKEELTYRMSQSASILVGRSPAERLNIFESMKKFYGRRSKLVHGRYSVPEYLAGKFVSHEECDGWASIIRQSILRYVVLLLRGENLRQEVQRKLEEAALNADVGEQMRHDSDPDAYLREHRNVHSSTPDALGSQENGN